MENERNHILPEYLDGNHYPFSVFHFPFSIKKL